MENSNKKIKISIIGDLMSNHDQIPRLINSGYEKVFENVYGEFDDCDLLIANLETPLSRNKNNYASKKYSFCAPVEFARSANKLSKNTVLLTANNHCLDRNVEGLKETLDILDEYGIKHTGTQKKGNTYLIDEIYGKKIAILNYTYGTNAFSNKCYLNSSELQFVNLLQPQEESGFFYQVIMKSMFFPWRVIRKISKIFGLFSLNVMPYERVQRNKKLEKKYIDTLKGAVAESDFVISCLHIGGQYNSTPSEYTKNVVEKSIKAGANVVSCNHEHVIHTLGEKGKAIYNYSLGNFVGTSGVIDAPFNKNSDISMGMNFYLDLRTKEVKYSYTLYMCKADEKGIVKVYPMYKLALEDSNILERYQEYTEMLSGARLSPSKEHFIKEGNINEKKY